MKLSQMLPGFLRQTDPTLSAPILSDFNLPKVPKSPFEVMEDHLAELIAAETAARAAHEATVQALNEHSAKLKLMLETHLNAVQALYTQVSPVNTEKT